jgi:PAS domain S-box-containing protein
MAGNVKIRRPAIARGPTTAEQTILLVEDEVIIAMQEKMVLERAGYQVLTATSGEEAIHLAMTTPEISLILMDIDLGAGMSGTQAAAIIIAECDLPVTFLSSHTEAEVVNATDDISGYGYIVKNSGEMVLLTSIKMALRLHWSERRFARVLSTVPEVSIQGYSADGTTNYWNHAAERLYGYSAEEAVGKKLWDLIIPPEMVDGVKQAVAKMIETGRPNPPETLSLQRKEGSRITVRSNHVITHDFQGKHELFCLDVPGCSEEGYVVVPPSE